MNLTKIFLERETAFTVVLWPKLHLFYLSHFKTSKVVCMRKKCCVSIFKYRFTRYLKKCTWSVIYCGDFFGRGGIFLASENYIRGVDFWESLAWMASAVKFTFKHCSNMWDSIQVILNFWKKMTQSSTTLT